MRVNGLRFRVEDVSALDVLDGRFRSGFRTFLAWTSFRGLVLGIGAL